MARRQLRWEFGKTFEKFWEKTFFFKREMHLPSPEKLWQQTGFLADRMSVNLELPTAEGLRTLAPNKHRKSILSMVKVGFRMIPELKNNPSM